jgi:hypothetical protein
MVRPPDIVEAGDQVDDGGLAGAGGADDGDGLPGLGAEADIAQHGLPGQVFGADVVEDYPPLDFGQAPGVRGILDGRHHIQQAEDALGASHGALDIGPQHGDLLDGLVEALTQPRRDEQAERDGCSSSAWPQQRGEPPTPQSPTPRNPAPQGGGQGRSEGHSADIGIG